MPHTPGDPHAKTEPPPPPGGLEMSHAGMLEDAPNAAGVAELGEIELPSLAEQPVRRRRSGVLAVSLGVFFTILVHGVVVYAAYYATTAEDDVTYAPPNVIDARLLKLGKTITPDMLPKKTVAAPPPPKKVVGLMSDPTAPKTPDRPDAPDPKSPDEATKDSKLLDSLTDFDPDAKPSDPSLEGAGVEDGVKSGTLTDPSKARAIDKWMTKFQKLFDVEWARASVGSMSKDKRDKLACKVLLEVSRTGEFTEVKMVRKSDDDLFDSACKAAAGAVKKIPDDLLDSLPPELERIYVDGIDVTFKGSDLP